MSADPRLARMRPPPSSTPPAQLPQSSTPPAAGSRPANGPAVPTPPPIQVANGVEADEDSFKLKFCTVCASNNNRSMEGHLRLADAKYPVMSFGTGSLVRLPGPALNQPNIYNFNMASYDQMYRELEEKDPNLYRSNGILKMLERNRHIKTGPERWQDWKVGDPRLAARAQDQGLKGTENGMVDIVVTCEERCWDAVVEDLLNRGSPLDRPVHVFNVEISDSHAEALVGGRAIVDLADSLNKAAIEERDAKGEEGWEDGQGHSRQGFDERVPDILAAWQERWPDYPALWTLSWF